MAKTAVIHRQLLAWYAREKRELPWRASRDPYRIWISEIMLQQTRVEAVIPYYQRFLSHFPTVRALAEAEPDTLLNLWAGLGYYSRARNLQAAAKEMVARFGGALPEALEDLRSLKGIGPYTAAAIASIAFGQPHAAIDGNLERVLARLLALRDDPKAKVGRAQVESLANALVALGQAGEVNQALMDLSSAICKPKTPDCGRCPLSAHCEAHARGIAGELPVRKARAAPIRLVAEGWVVLSDGHLLLARRAQGEWLSGLWDLPWRLGPEGAAPAFGHTSGRCQVKRTITKHKIAFSVSALVCEKRPSEKQIAALGAKASELRWVRLDDLHGVSLPRPSEAALEKLLAGVEA